MRSIAIYKEVTAGLQMQSHEFAWWQELLLAEGLERLKADGKTILRDLAKQIAGMLKHVYIDRLPPHQAPTGAWLVGHPALSFSEEEPLVLWQDV